MDVAQFLQNSPPYVVVGVVGFFALKWGFSFLRESVTALVGLGKQYLTTINGYFAALSDNNLLIQKAITESGIQHKAALDKVTASNELTGTNLEQLSLLVKTQAATLEAQTRQSSESAQQLLNTIQSRADELKKQGDILSQAIVENAEKQTLGFNEMRDILNAIDTKLDSSSTTLVNQIVAQFKPAFDNQIQASNAVEELAKQVIAVQESVNNSARQLETTFLTAIGQIVNSIAKNPSSAEPSITSNLNGESNHAGA